MAQSINETNASAGINFQFPYLGDSYWLLFPARAESAREIIAFNSLIWETLIGSVCGAFGIGIYDDVRFQFPYLGDSYWLREASLLGRRSLSI